MPVNQIPLESVSVNASDVKELTGWPNLMINDYLTISRNLFSIVNNINVVIDQVTINEENIEINRLAIEGLSLALSDHTNSNSGHGVTGVNVGSEDFCTGVIGGVVLLANNVSELTEVVISDVGVAPATYDQAYTQSVTDLTNANKAKINEIVNKVNAIIQAQISAKQMGA